jgi:hypothetical protein
MRFFSYIILVVILALATSYAALEYIFGASTDDPNFIAKDILHEIQ